MSGAGTVRMQILSKKKEVDGSVGPSALGFSPVEFVSGSQGAALLRPFWNPFRCPSVEVTLPDTLNHKIALNRESPYFKNTPLMSTDYRIDKLK